MRGIYIGEKQRTQDICKPIVTFTEAVGCRSRGLSSTFPHCHDLLRLGGNPAALRDWEYKMYLSLLQIQNSRITSLHKDTLTCTYYALAAI